MEPYSARSRHNQDIIQLTIVLIRRENRDPYTEGKVRPGEGDHHVKMEMHLQPRNTKKLQELQPPEAGSESWNRLSFRTSRRNQVCQTSLQNCKKIGVCCFKSPLWSHLVVVICYGSPRKLTQLVKCYNTMSIKLCGNSEKEINCLGGGVKKYLITRESMSYIQEWQKKKKKLWFEHNYTFGSGVVRKITRSTGSSKVLKSHSMES